MSYAAPPARFQPLFGSWFMGGFECSAHVLRSGRRLDLTASTGHGQRAAEDYRALQAHGMRAARDGFRWHLIEQQAGVYDWASALPMIRAARDCGVDIVWDLLHYGVPDDVDVFSTAFIDRFARFAAAVARLLREETDQPVMMTPINEISFWSWAGGDCAGLNPFRKRSGPRLKRQLVQAALGAIDAARSIDRSIVICTSEPLIHVHPSVAKHEAHERAASYNESQFEAIDMLLGRLAPELGGSEDAVDVVGVNYYYNNQWIDRGSTLYLGHWLHRPLHELLLEVAKRYRLPMYLSETGTEGIFRPYWLRYVVDEALHAIERGVPLGGICLYPIISHLGWDDDRLCLNGLFEGHDAGAPRHVYEPLAPELRLQQERHLKLLPMGH